MSDSNRGERTQALAEQGEEADGGDQGTGGNGERGDSQAGSVPVVVEQPPSPNEATERQPNTEGQEADPYKARDIVAQEAMADASVAMAIAAFLTVFITAVGTWLIREQIKLTRHAVKSTNDATKAMLRSNEIAERLGEAQIRSYISGSECRIGFVDDIVIINCDIKNSGQSPARSVTVSAALTIYNGDQIWTFDQSRPGSVMSSADIAANETRTLPIYISADVSNVHDGPPTDSGIRFTVTARVKMNGQDVFGRTISEEGEFIAFHRAGLHDISWIKAEPVRALITNQESTNDDSRHHEGC